MKFRAKVIPSGNAAAAEIPAKVMKSLGAEARPAISITINGHTWHSRVALMRGKRLIGISAANRAAAGIVEGETVELDVALDSAPREVAEPYDLSVVLNKNKQVRACFDKLPFGLRRKHTASIEDAKSPETRKRRIDKLVESLKDAR